MYTFPAYTSTWEEAAAGGKKMGKRWKLGQILFLHIVLLVAASALRSEFFFFVVT